MQWISRKWYVMQNYILIIFLWTFPHWLLYFADKFQNTDNFAWNCPYFENCPWNTTASTKTFTKNSLRHYFALHSTSNLSIELSKNLSHSKTIKNGKKLSVFDENDSSRLFNFLRTHRFWNIDHISRTYNQINYKNIWFPKVIIILIMAA